MRKLFVVGLMTALALTLVGVAVAHLTASGTTAVSAMFSATSPQGFNSRTCNGPDGQYQLIDARYTGSSTSSESSLNGDVRIRIRSVYNTTEKTGWATGWLKLHDATTRFDAVNVNGKLSGFVRGRVGGHYGDLLATFTADFSSGGLANGQLGGGGALPNVGLLAGKTCNGPDTGKSVKLTVEGTIDSIVPGTSVTVAPEDSSALQTCALGPGSPSIAGFTKGQKVEMTCETVDGKLTVTRLKKRG